MVVTSFWCSQKVEMRTGTVGTDSRTSGGILSGFSFFHLLLLLAASHVTYSVVDLNGSRLHTLFFLYKDCHYFFPPSCNANQASRLHAAASIYWKIGRDPESCSASIISSASLSAAMDGLCVRFTIFVCPSWSISFTCISLCWPSLPSTKEMKKAIQLSSQGPIAVGRKAE